MAIRTNTNPRQMDLQPELRDILMRNGLQAHVALDSGGLPAARAGARLAAAELPDHRAADARAHGLGDAHGQQESLQRADGYPVERFLPAQGFRPCPQRQRPRSHGAARLPHRHRRVRTAGTVGHAPRRFWAGRRATNGASTCGGSAGGSSIRDRTPFPNDGTGA